MRDLILWGAGGHAKVLRECAGHLGYRLVALFDNSRVPPPFDDVPLYYGESGFRDWLESAGPGEAFGLPAIGGGRGRDRLHIHQLFESNGVRVPTLVHPSSFVASNVVLGRGVQVLAGATLAVECNVADACIINTNSSVDHECTLGPGVHVGPGAVLAGCVHVGENAFVGAGAVILPRIRIGENAVVGAGAVVTRDVPPASVVYGNPARPRSVNHPPPPPSP